tara:strand:- start:834 stop:2090 length:1257 start_codon:yes stop_codon:yes gene_type:complete
MYNSDSFYKKNNINFVFPYDESNIPIYDAKEDEGGILSAFTIDDESTYDHDDAITIKKNQQVFELYVHITNFSNYIDYGSEYDKEAKNRTNTIYTPIWNFDLYERKIVENISLKEGELRETISIKFTILDYKIEDTEVFNSTINIDKNYSYKEFDKNIQLSEEFIFLDEFTNRIRQKRILNADFKSFNEQLSISEVDNKLFIKSNDQFISFRIVSELMILANEKLSEYTIGNSIPSIYRSQVKSDYLEILELPTTPKVVFYKNVSPVEVSTEYGYHFGLGVNSYLQFTSPIRRYSDSILMRQLDAWLKYSRIMFSANELNSIIRTTKDSIQLSRRKSRNTHKFWALKFIETNNLKNLSGYIYSDAKSQYVIYFNEIGFFHSIKKISCKKTYKIMDKIEISYSSLNPELLTFNDIEDIV